MSLLGWGKEKTSFDSWDSSKLFDINPREFITPRMSQMDKSDLTRMVERSINNEQEWSNDKKQKITEMWKNFPKYFLYNLFNQYNLTPEAKTIDKISEENQWQFDLSMKLDDYYMKALTHTHDINSGIMSTEITKQLLINMVEQQEQESGGGQGDNSQGSQEKMMQSMAGQGSGQGDSGKDMSKELEAASKKAEQQMKEADDLAGMGLQAGKGSSDGLSMDDLAELLKLKEALGGVNLTSSALTGFVKEVLKKSRSYFSSTFSTFYEEFIDSESDEIANIEELSPIFRKLNLDDIISEDRVYHAKFDVYVDCSGSMTSSVLVGKVNVPGYMLAKICAMKIHNMHLAEDLYLFNTDVKPFGSDINKFIHTRTSGGTRIDAVIENMERVGRPGLIITDACDNMQSYSNLAYILTINGGIIQQNRYSNSKTDNPSFYARKQVAGFEAGQFFTTTSEEDHRKKIGELGGYTNYY